VGKIDPVPQGVALGWANGWAFGPHDRCQEIVLDPGRFRAWLIIANLL
jgi:hypothetical protein